MLNRTRVADPAFLDRLKRAPLDERTALLASTVKAWLAEFMGWTSPRPIEPTLNLIELGIDSLRAVDFKVLLEERLECSLRSSLLFDHPTLDALVTHLAQSVHPGPSSRSVAFATAHAEALEHLPSTALFRLLNEAAQRLHAREEQRNEPIAVVGMGCRFPGGVTSPEEFWSLQVRGGDAITEVPPDRWDIDAFYDPDPAAPGKMSTRYGGFIADLDRFDAQFFGISAREAAQMDPQQRLVLEVAWEAIENAGYSPKALAGQPVGVFTGTRASEYQWSQPNIRPERVGPYFATGDSISMTAGRLSYTLGLTGPSLALDTACSSSLVALHLACESIRQDECRAALVCGVNVILLSHGSIATSKAGMLARDGRCKTFAAAADGYVRAEGCGVVFLKRFSDARRDGDRILALVRGSAVNQDGASAGLTVPSGPAQEAVIQRALRHAGVAPSDIDYIEAHGTGTALGDPIEVNALGAIFAPDRSPDRPLLVGSVKTNLGHLETAAGMAGFMKLCLALHHGTIPAHLHFERPSPFIPWSELPLKVPVQNTAWPRRSHPRIGGVSSFGFSGTNAHVVVSEAPEEPPVTRGERSAYLLALSAKTKQGVQELAGRYHDRLTAAAPPDLPDLCFTANTGRAHFTHRVALLCKDLSELAQKLSDVRRGVEPTGVSSGTASSEAPKVAFLFSGQGSQVPHMGKGLYACQPVFREAIERCDQILRPHLGRSLLALLWGADEALLGETRFTQPALFALEYALLTLWSSWGIQPAAVLGHSVGEYVAAYAAGVFSLEDSLGLIAARGRLMQERTEPGEMVVVFASVDRVRPLLAEWEDTVALAAINGPSNVVVSGAPAAVRAIVGALDAAGVKTRKLDVTRAFHSPLMAPMLRPFAEIAANIDFASPRIPFISNLTGALAGGEVASIDSWVRHIRSPVRFSAGMAALAELGPDVFLEIGPSPALLPMARACVPPGDALWLPSLREGRDDLHEMLRSTAELYVRGAPIDWTNIDRGERRRKVDLPTYPFQRQRCWIEGELPTAASSSSRAGRIVHPLLGSRLRSPVLKKGSLHFESELGQRSPAFLKHHGVHGAVIVPGAAFLEMALAAGILALKSGEVSVDNVAIQAPLILPDEGTATMQVLLTTEEKEQGYRVEIYRLKDEEDAAEDQTENAWTLHASGRVGPLRGGAVERGALAFESLQAVEARCAEAIDIPAYYQTYRELGLDYGESFQVLERLQRRDGEALALVRLPEALVAEVASYQIHPVLLDGCFQAVGALMKEETHGEIVLPVGVERLRLHRKPDGPAKAEPRPTSTETRLFCRAVLRALEHADQKHRWVDFHLIGLDGQLIAEVDGLQLIPAPRSALFRPHSDIAKDLLYTITWPARPLAARSGAIDAFANPSAPAAQAPRGWLLFAAPASRVAIELAKRLTEAGEHVVTVLAGDHGTSSIEGLRRILSEGFGGTRPRCVGVVHLVSVDAPEGILEGAEDLERLVQRSCGSVLHLVQALEQIAWPEPPRLWLVTRGAQAGGDTSLARVEQAPLWGLGATIALEHPELRCVRIDLDPLGAEREGRALFAELLSPDEEEQIAYRGGARRAARLGRLLPPMPTTRAAGPFRVCISAYGMLENLAIRPLHRRMPGPTEVEIEVAASGINFKDVLHALGLLKEYSERAGILQAPDLPLGVECAGTVVAVGEAVTGLAVGDEVVAMAPGCMGSHVTTEAALVVRKPERLSFTEAAALPAVFSTAIYSLERLARIQRGERVLIHAAAGGVGQAALQLALRAGAEVFATASPTKWDFLKAQGVARTMSSRTLDFAEEILSMTGGEGVDVVLNSLTGDFIPKSLSVLRSHGRYVEIGKIGVWDAARVAELRPDVRYFVFDLSEIGRDGEGFGAEGALVATRSPNGGKSLQAGLLAEAMAAFAEGSLRPLPTKVFEVGEVASAFRYLAQAKNIGKVVLSIAPEGRAEGVDAPEIRADRSYWITGGLGALGLACAEWMVEQGARALALSGRSDPSSDAQAAIRRMEEAGAAVRCLKMDVSKQDDVAAALSSIQATMPPLGGVVHAAGILDDGVLSRLDEARFSKVMAPKVLGALHLHRLTQALDLQWFVCFSSVASLLGSPGQANYAAANAFMDALAHHRRGRGLPGLSIHWGPWAGGGMAAGSARRNQVRFAEIGLSRISPAEGVQIFGHLLRTREAQVGVVPIRWGHFLRQFRAHPRPRFFDAFAAEEAPVAQGSTLRQELDRAPLDERRPMLARFLTEQLAKVLGLSATETIEPRRPLFELGVDSLMATELRNRIEGQLGCTLNATLVFNYPTIEAMVDYLAEQVLASPPQTAAAAPPPALVMAESDAPPSASLAQDLSEEEILRRLSERVDRILGEDIG